MNFFSALSPFTDDERGVTKRTVGDAAVYPLSKRNLNTTRICDVRKGPGVVLLGGEEITTHQLGSATWKMTTEGVAEEEA